MSTIQIGVDLAKTVFEVAVSTARTHHELLKDHRDGDRSDRRGDEPITRMAVRAATNDWLPTRDLPS